MSTKRGWGAALATAAFTVSAWAQTPPADPFAPGAAIAQADDAPAPKAAPKRAARTSSAGATFLVMVNNKRMVGLIALMLAPAGEDNAVKIAGPLAFGRKTMVRVKRTKDCLYDVRGKFADEADTEQLGVDLCKDKVINLTDE